jgi:lysophospholipase L1-like esterase
MPLAVMLTLAGTVTGAGRPVSYVALGDSLTAGQGAHRG